MNEPNQRMNEPMEFTKDKSTKECTEISMEGTKGNYKKQYVSLCTFVRINFKESLQNQILLSILSSSIEDKGI